MATEIKHYLDLTTLKEVPESHAWDLDESPVVEFSESPIAVVDLEAENAEELIGKACREWGIMIIVNHGMREGLLEEVDAASRHLFALPMEEKLKTLVKERGGAGYGLPAVSNLYPALHWKEGFNVIQSPLEHAKILWPQDYQSFCDVIEEYKKELKALASRMVCLMLSALGLTSNDPEWQQIKSDFEGGASNLTMNSYPPCPNPDRTMGLGAHTDSGLVTILRQTSSGLQVHKEGIGWVSIPYFPGSLTVNVGDMFHMVSNGLFHSVVHRAAVTSKTLHRYSDAYFYVPQLDASFAPLPQLIDDSHPPLFNRITWRRYRQLKFQYNSGTLSKVRLSTPGNQNVEDNHDNPEQ